MTSKAHTYASENADYYHGFDAGQRDAGERLSALLQAHRNKWFADDGKQKKWFAEKVLGVPKEET